MFGHLRAAIRLAAAAALASACGGAKSPAPVVRLGPATDSVMAPYTEISEGTWLGGRRWATLAAGEEVVAMVDLDAHEVGRLGGPGGGLAELRNPATLFRAGDTLYVGDWGLRRTTLWTLDGRAIRAIPAPDALRGVLPRARDRQGRFYFEVAPRPGPDGQGNRDSAVVVRTGPALERPDTLARLSPADLAEVVGDAGRRFERRVFSGVDRWGVLPDGSLWVARVYDNRVDWRDPDGSWRRGEPLPDRVLEVTRYDRELFFRKFPPELRSTAERLPFAAIKPPFEAGFTDPAGYVWLEKSRAPADSGRSYHLVDRRGRLRREIHLSGPGRIIAAGMGSVLAARSDRDGVYLSRIVVPPADSAR
jgi:hypothetical protein